MELIGLIIGGWLLCAVASVYFAQDWFRSSLNVEMADLLFFAAMGVLGGPISLIATVSLWAFEKIGRRVPRRVIWRRK